MGQRDPIEGLSEGVPEFVEGAEAFAAEPGFDLREGLFDGVEVGAVRREVEDAGVVFGEERGDTGEFVGGEVVEDDEVAGSERGEENLAEVGEEVRAGEGAVDDHRRDESGQPQAAEKRRGFPVALGDGIDHALAFGSPAVEAGHRGRTEGLVEEDEPTRVEAGPDDLPLGPFDCDVRPVLLRRPERLFLSEKPKARNACQIVPIDSDRPRSAFSCVSVVPGCCWTWAAIRSPWRSASDVRWLADDRIASDFPFFCRRLIESTHARLTPNASRIAFFVQP